MEHAWKLVCRTDEIDMDSTKAVVIDEIPICLYRLEDGIFATHDVCTHGQASLADGYVEGGAIECPLHQGTFDIRTGEALTSPCVIGLKVYPAKQENGIVWVKVEG
jgi:nitrite reductase/ring-hydroxylating ferredoxin subunit